MQSVGDWLDGLGVPQYENILIPNGFDDMEFMVRLMEYMQSHFRMLGLNEIKQDGLSIISILIYFTKNNFEPRRLIYSLAPRFRPRFRFPRVRSLF